MRHCHNCDLDYSVNAPFCIVCGSPFKDTEDERVTNEAAPYQVEECKREENEGRERATKLEAPIVCPKCGNENLPDAVFCQKCAVRIVPAEYCRFCGNEIFSGEQYCSHCKHDKVGNIISSNKLQSAFNMPDYRIFFLAITITCILILLSLCKWITIPAINALGGAESSYSLFQIRDFLYKVGNFSESIGSGNSLRSYSFLFILPFTINIVLYVFAGYFLIKKNGKFYSVLQSALWGTAILVVILIFAMIAINDSISEMSGGFIESAIELTAAPYIACIAALIFSIWGIPKLKKQGFLLAERLVQK